MAIANETIAERPTSAVFAAGRVFYLVNSIVYYSQVLEGNTVSTLSKCYQKNDPTAEQLNDLLDTDGGTISINDAGKGVSIREARGGVLVLFDNGAWHITGPEGGFTATDFSVSKITDEGCVSAQSVVQVDGVTFYWGNRSITSVQLNQFGILEATPISDNIIETLYTNITLNSKKGCSGFFNSEDNVIEWFYNSQSTAASTDLIYAHDKGLSLNLKTGGFFKQSFNGKTAESTTDTTSLVTGVDLSKIRNDGIFYISYSQVSSGGNSTLEVKTGRRDSESFQDFGTDYSTAFLETGYEALDKPSNIKSAPYITTHFNQTEENWVTDGAGGVMLDKQSGCKMRARWDWNDTDANGRWSPPQQVYRFRRTNIPSGVGAFNSGETVVTTKNKMLGRGKALSMRFEQESGKDMQLLGWTILWTIRSNM